MGSLALVRDTLLATIVELASRDGQLRRGTEILHINLKSETGSQTPPALIAQMGDDIAVRAFQHPYLFYKTKYGSSETLNGGWVNPFFWSGWPDPDTNAETYPNYAAFQSDTSSNNAALDDYL